MDTNLKPANEFYRNLMTPEHMEQYGDWIRSMLQNERKFYTEKLFLNIQKEFDYTCYLHEINKKIYAIYGDRNPSDYDHKVEDLNLPIELLESLELRFLPNACHMMMIENPTGLQSELDSIISLPPSSEQL